MLPEPYLLSREQQHTHIKRSSHESLNCRAETIGQSASYPSVDMTKLSNGEGTDGTSDTLKTQMLPDNGVLWNLDRIDQRNLPLNREYT